MRTAITASLLTLALAALSVPAGAEEGPRPYELIEVADGVWAAEKPAAERLNDSNALVVVGKRELLVVDAQADPAAVRSLIAELRKRFDRPVRYLVNTHWHPDHTQGNRLYLDAYPELEILGHESLLEDLTDRAAPMLAEEIETWRSAIARAERILASGTDPNGREMTAERKAAAAEEIAAARARVETLEATAVAPPTRPIAETTTIRLGDREVRLLPFRGHTRGDLAVYLPSERVLAAGDLVDDVPYAGDAFPAEWIRALEALRALDLAVVVPGHGAVRRDKGQIDTVLELLRAAVDHVTGPAGKSPSFELVMEALDYPALRDRFGGSDEAAARAFESNVPTLFERAWLESRRELAE